MKSKLTKVLKIAGICVLVLAALPFVLAAVIVWLAVTSAKAGAVALRKRRNRFSTE